MPSTRRLPPLRARATYCFCARTLSWRSHSTKSGSTSPGEAFPVAEQVGALRALGLFSASANGVLAHRSGADNGNLRLVWFDRQGNSKGVLGLGGLYRGVSISPDGSKVAVNRDDPGSANS